MTCVHQCLSKANLHQDALGLILQLLRVVLTWNYFMFEDKYCLQIRGTAMGSYVAPPYAICYMAVLEQEVVYTDPIYERHCLRWRRCIDDVFCIWTGLQDTLDTFFNNLNSAWPGLQFTITRSRHNVSFLDMMVDKDNAGTLRTDLYTKPTGRNSLLHFSSQHPPTTKKLIPKSQFKRVNRIVSDATQRQHHFKQMHLKFSEQGYSSASAAPQGPGRCSNVIFLLGRVKLRLEAKKDNCIQQSASVISLQNAKVFQAICSIAWKTD
ncbi:unnamed protein product [Ranitomeya imitator]|uniref:Helix-turn-helix domain-containing protein n=1 Tax=Ranitomeya imitator TaxID=111125 RepID=A0ABN9M0D3_9NEOB|nr:unnamed protein product [Ranitomeya imitator]